MQLLHPPTPTLYASIILPTSLRDWPVCRNFSEYKARFTMPGSAKNLFYTLELGPVQLVAISSEVYYFLKYGTHMAINQYNWLVNVLRVRHTLLVKRSSRFNVQLRFGWNASGRGFFKDVIIVI